MISLKDKCFGSQCTWKDTVTPEWMFLKWYCIPGCYSIYQWTNWGLYTHIYTNTKLFMFAPRPVGFGEMFFKIWLWKMQFFIFHFFNTLHSRVVLLIQHPFLSLCMKPKQQGINLLSKMIFFSIKERIFNRKIS